MELRSGSIRVTAERYDDDGNEQNQRILVDIDGNMRMAGTGTLVYNGSAVLTEIANGYDYELRHYTTDGIRCETLDRSDPRFHDMSNKRTITYVFSKEFDTFVSLAGVVNADLVYSQDLGAPIPDTLYLFIEMPPP